MEFQRSQPGHRGMGKLGKFFCVFVFNPAVGGGTGGSSSVPNKRSLPSTSTVTGSQSLDSLFYIIGMQMPTIHVAEEKQA